MAIATKVLTRRSLRQQTRQRESHTLINIKSTIAAKGACTRYHLGCNDASHYHFINIRSPDIREHILAWCSRSQRMWLFLSHSGVDTYPNESQL